MIKGSAWMVGMRWCVRGIGLINTIILARLLSPVDFGIVAMAMIVVGLLEVLTTFGVDQALIQQQDQATREHYNTAWTFKILQGLLIAVGLLAAAPWISVYFQEPRIQKIAFPLGMAAFIQGFENIGIVAFRKELSFSKEFLFQILKKLSTFIITVILALNLRNYWALVISMLCGRIIGVILSFILHPYRPWFCLTRMKEIWSFSQWILIFTVGQYLNTRVDVLFVGQFRSSSQMGIYQVSSDFSTMPTREFVWPLSRALLPGYAILSKNPKRLSNAFLNVVGIMAAVILPAGVGLSLVADTLIPVLLGPKWESAIPVMQWLAIYGIAFAVPGNARNLLLAIGQMYLVSGLVWCELLFAVPLMGWAAVHYGMVHVAFVRAVMGILFIPLYFQIVISCSHLKWPMLLEICWRPLISCGVMAGIMCSLLNQNNISPFLHLVNLICLGVASYTTSMIFLWSICGRPNGAEQQIIEMLARSFQNFQNRLNLGKKSSRKLSNLP